MSVGKIGQSGATESQLIGEYALDSLAGAYCVRVTLELYRKRTGATVSVAWTSAVRFRYSRLKEAALFAADAMGFQSTLAWKLLKGRVLAERPSKSKFINLTIKPQAHDRLIVTPD
jgi:hypothetical protein